MTVRAFDVVPEGPQLPARQARNQPARTDSMDSNFTHDSLGHSTDSELRSQAWTPAGWPEDRDVVVDPRYRDEDEGAYEVPIEPTELDDIDREDLARRSKRMAAENNEGDDEKDNKPPWLKDDDDDEEEEEDSKDDEDGNDDLKESRLLRAMALATLSEQRRLAAELEGLRSRRQARLQAGRDNDLAGAVILDSLTPVLTHSLHTTATDWLAEVPPASLPPEVLQQTMLTEASLFFDKISREVKVDRQEFVEQARGKGRTLASMYGPGSAVAFRTFIDHVATLYRRQAEVEGWGVGGDVGIDTVDWPLNPNEDEKENVDLWATRTTTRDTRDMGEFSSLSGTQLLRRKMGVAPQYVVVDETDGMIISAPGGGQSFTAQSAQAFADTRNSERKEGAQSYAVYRLTREGHFVRIAEDQETCAECGAPIERDPAHEDPQTWHHDDGSKHDHEARPASKESARHIATDDHPGKVDEDQSGNAESQTTYETPGVDPAPMDAPFWPEDECTGPEEVPSTRAPNITDPSKLPSAARVEGFRQLASAKVSGTVEGHPVNLLGASSVVAVYDRLSLRNQAQMAALTPSQMVAVAHRILNLAAAVTADKDSEWEQAGYARSDLGQVEVGDKDDRPMWPWELPNDDDDPESAKGAADVSKVPTPGGESGYPQPQRSSIDPQRLEAFRRKILATRATRR